MNLQDNPRKCAKCRQVAMRGRDHCVMHGRRRGMRGPGHGRTERRLLAGMEHIGLLPTELLALPVWRNLTGLATGQRSPMRLALVQAWDRRLTEPLLWAAVQRRAIALGATPGPRQHTAHWYENR